ncbi:MAG TPA: beta-ketoacyl-ACP synthase III [Kiritimatiellia bacterium]|jgi:3-oxoacyl-[acyl-carrier-protein] synthase-3|nr:MAG: 3-oxoacyl-(acyl-carrier-protein) synthase 3 [Verrucomicrobia bacterium ADurb.Bin070]HPB10953.1 beta-ketoacyl-ACP synthase III [Kiritimatiellia bacterium]HQL50471.1 beta-ketoacyl-ACP synthase III [Kiritimatiellia bacterium]HQQ91145.1 beta-ketoacyl-ACP synthase III [Kiritimatiellia bacterium]
MFVHITGTGSYLPERVVTNAELAAKLDTTDEWIYSHTGIRSRHIGADDESTSAMAVKAARAALASAGVAPEELGLIIVATSTSDYQAFPSTACLVQHELGAVNAACFDLQAACTGFIYALEAARGMLRQNPRPALVIGAEMMSRIVDWNDRNSCILFGDAAGAVVLEASHDVPGGIWHSILKADGSGSQLIVREGGARGLASGPWMQHTLQMKGRAVFNFAVKVFDEVLCGLLNRSGHTFADLACVIPHQANARIVEAVARRMEVPLETFYMNMETIGNSSAASIPVALDMAITSKKIKEGDLIAMVGFGAGLTYGGILMSWRGQAAKPALAAHPTA